MTQFIPNTKGKTYDLEHLRPFDLELAKKGHPLSTFDGCEVSHLFENNMYVCFENNRWVISGLSTHGSVYELLSLAPLAIKDGKPIHFGDVLEHKVIMFEGEGWLREVVKLSNWKHLNTYGRWPVE